ncbi:MAG: phosphoethanolamine transferase CptA [Lachnospiraceae bacterium]|nr:phosphoethanolamine transferase CptA [Lachnospiraceae bacterium]
MSSKNNRKPNKTAKRNRIIAAVIAIVLVLSMVISLGLSIII